LKEQLKNTEIDRSYQFLRSSLQLYITLIQKGISLLMLFFFGQKYKEVEKKWIAIQQNGEE